MSVLIIDCRPLVHGVLTSIVRSVLGDVKVRTARNLEGGVAIIRSDPKVDLVLLDLDLPGCTGIESLTRFRSIFPTVPVLVMSTNDSRTVIHAAFKGGAIGYLPKSLNRKVMAGALHVISAGGFYVPYEALGDGFNCKSCDGNGEDAAVQLGLTHRQYQVLQLIQKGYNNGKIARQLAISEGTVKQHVHGVLSALGVSSRTEAVAATNGLGHPQE